MQNNEIQLPGRQSKFSYRKEFIREEKLIQEFPGFGVSLWPKGLTQGLIQRERPCYHRVSYRAAPVCLPAQSLALHSAIDKKFFFFLFLNFSLFFLISKMMVYEKEIIFRSKHFGKYSFTDKKML